MARRFYISDWVREDNLIRPALQDYWPATTQYGDGRVGATTSGDICLTGAEISDEAHALAIADPRIRYIPLEGPGGKLLETTATIGDLSKSNRDAIALRLEAHHVPIDDLTLTDTIGAVLDRIVWRLNLRSADLRDIDWWEGLDTVVSTIPSTRRSAVVDRLQTRGYDTSTLTGSDTLRAVLRKLANQREPSGNF